jgi:hypothetical protein
VSVGRIPQAAAIAVLVALIDANGCGGSAFTAGPPDATSVATSDSGADATTGDSSQPESGAHDTGVPACILPPNGVDGEGEVCSILATTASACGECEACRQLDENDCVSLADTLSDAFKNALRTCASKLGCGDLSSLTNNPCIRAQLGAAMPTSAQQDVRAAYCKTCPTNQAECQGFFDFAPDAASAGYGIWAMVLSDSLDAQLVSVCSSTSPHCDALGYGVCGALVFCGKAPHSHCPHGLCN